MTIGILFDNGCTTQICARYSHKLKTAFTTLQILQRYLDDHRSVEWMKKIEYATDFAERIRGAEMEIAVVGGVWNDNGWQEDESFFDESRIVKYIPFLDLNWNYN